MDQKRNPYKDIYFYPDAGVERRFSAVNTIGRRTRVIGYFPSIAVAIAARDQFEKSKEAQ
jgi:hypothetical protein